MSLSDYFTPTERAPYPRSGAIVGAVADFLGLKKLFAAHDAPAGERHARRFFAGDPEIAPETAARIVSAVVDAAVPDGLASELAIGETAGHAVLRQAVLAWLQHYDVTTAKLNGQSFPLISPPFALVPYLRLATLDTAIRWGAFQWLRERAGVDAADVPRWLRPDALAVVIDRYRGDRTNEEIARASGVSANTISAWRSGSAVPERLENAEFLADALAHRGRAPRDEILFEVRLAAAGVAVLRFLGTHLGTPDLAPALVSDLVGAFETTARLTRRALGEIDSKTKGDALRMFAQALVLAGARAPGADMLCASLRAIAMRGWNENVAYDFAALPGDWNERLAHWARHVGSFDSAAEKLRAALGATVQVDELMNATVLMLIRMDGYAREVEGVVYRIKNPPEAAYHGRLGQAADARSIGELDAAVDHARRAVAHQPLRAQGHFVLGAYLGEFVAHGLLHHLDEAVHECRVAYELDRARPEPLNEIAVILSNARLYEQAEQAYADAASACDWWVVHHFGRGLNHLALRRYPDARGCFEKALALDPAHTEAKVRLAAVLHRLGDRKQARRVAREIVREVGYDPLQHVDRWLALHPEQLPEAP